MNITTLLRYLIGDREAILTIAGNRHALWIGLLFVVSAGLAREYDAEDLLHEPWYALIPVAASLGSSLLLFLVAFVVAAIRGGATWSNIVPSYAAFLGLFWMTAPLAWLYAVPYEQFLTPADAMRANLVTLGLVSAWRVAIMVRVLMVLFGYSIQSAVVLVLLFADVVALVLLRTLPFPLIEVMGGIRLSESDTILRETAVTVCMVGVCSAPVWFFGGWIILFTSQPKLQLPPTEEQAPLGLVAVAACSVLLWEIVLPFTQPQQLRRHAVEKLFRHKRFDRALREMSRHQRADYPAMWEPPPRHVNPHSMSDDVRGILEAMAKEPPADWVREIYLDKALRVLEYDFLDTERTKAYLKALKSIPGGQSMVDRLIEDLERQGNKYRAGELRQALEETSKPPRPPDDGKQAR